MSKINIIQNAIKELEGGSFQKLFDAYLYKKYKFTNIQTLGVQDGTNKTTKGTPDSFVVEDDGKYILIMYGTVGTEAFGKMKKDILSCFNKDKLKIDENKIKADILSIDEMGNELPIKVYLFQGLPKQEKMELIIQKMVELGVYSIIPVAMKRCVVKLDNKKAKSKVQRWNNIAESAAKQSKRSIVPQVQQVMTFKEALTYAQNLDIKLLPYECAEGMEQTRNIIEQLAVGQSVGIFIGPEGGYDLSELELAKQYEWESITLGKRILRTETAGIMLMSVLMYKMEGF